MTHRPRPTAGTVLRRAALPLLLVACAGCAADPAQPEVVWGKQGVQDGELSRPRAIAIDSHDRLYIVDFTARIQVYDRDGNYLGKTWSTPDYRNGRPSGLSIDRDDHLICSDSHYHCIRIYSADGKELRVLGGQGGSEPGQLGYVSDVVQDADGCYYVAEFGENHRITKLDPAGKFIKCWGSEGTEPGQLSRAAPSPSAPRMAISTWPTPSTTAFRSSRATVSWCASGASRATGRVR